MHEFLLDFTFLPDLVVRIAQTRSGFGGKLGFPPFRGDDPVISKTPFIAFG